MSSRPSRRRFGGAARLIVALPLLAVVTATGSAAAALHLALNSSEPASGAQLDRAPTELRLTFTEPVEVPTSRVLLRAPDGSAIPLAPLRAGDDRRVLLATLSGDLRLSGRYDVEWRAVGRDGHPVAGAFHFNVVEGAAGIVPIDTSDTILPPSDVQAAPLAISAGFDTRSPLYVAVRWLGYLALVPLIGALAYRWLLMPRLAATPELGRSSSAMAVRLQRWARAFALLLVAALLLRLVAQLAALYGSLGAVSPGWFSRLIATTWGQAWLLQLGGAIIIATALALSRSRAGWILATLAALPIVIGAGLAGHAATAEGLAPVLVMAHALHIAGAGGWLGSLLMVLIVGAPALREGDAPRGPALARLVNAFSPVALLCAALLVVTGAGAALWHLGSLEALAVSDYGRTLLLKLSLLVPVLALGAYNWRLVRPTLHQRAQPERSLARTAGAELAFAALVLTVTAVLVATPPPAP